MPDDDDEAVIRALQRVDELKEWGKQRTLEKAGDDLQSALRFRHDKRYPEQATTNADVALAARAFLMLWVEQGQPD